MSSLNVESLYNAVLSKCCNVHLIGLFTKNRKFSTIKGNIAITKEEFIMKKLLQMIRHLVALTVMLFLYSSHVFALSIIDDPFEKIPIASPVPTPTEILIIPPDFPILPPIFPILPSCNETFPDPELFYTGRTERTVNGVDFIYHSLAINNKEEYPDYLFAS